jgi:hypothetical protein
MTTDELIAVALPFVLAVVLVGGALAGSRLSSMMRMRIVRLLLAPLYVAVGVAILAYVIIGKHWAELLWTMPLVSLAIFQVYRLYRPIKQTTDS